MSQVRKHYKRYTISWKSIINIVCFTTLFLFVVYAVNQIKAAGYFPIKEVKIAGVQHVSRHEMERLLAPLVSKGFFAVNVDHIKESVMQFPWVAEASVRRVWPHQIMIQVTEKLPLALWNNGQLLSVSGQLFTPARETYPDELPQLIGTEGTQLKMMESYTKVNQVLAPLHFKIKRLELSPAHVWSLTLNNGIKLNVGHKDILTRVADFVKVYPRIIGSRASDVDSVDLRYSNGLAVRWKTIT